LQAAKPSFRRAEKPYNGGFSGSGIAPFVGDASPDLTDRNGESHAQAKDPQRLKEAVSDHRPRQGHAPPSGHEPFE
jgi:hypothetical protein